MGETMQERNLIPPGTAAYVATSLEARHHGQAVAQVQLSEPVVIAVASKPEDWGYFQFPSIGRTAEGALQVHWSMHADSIKSYGKGGGGAAISNDEGKSWTVSEPPVKTIEGLLLPNGDRIAVVTPAAIKVEDLALPKPVGAGSDTYAKSKQTLYRLSEMPASRQGVYLKRLPRGATKWVQEHASLDDPKALRYSFAGLVPVVWWGDMHVASDGSVIAGIYPGFQLKDDNTADPKCGIYFYRSTDEGHSWKIQGRIPLSIRCIRRFKGSRADGVYRRRL